jgi:hypothetical protein
VLVRALAGAAEPIRIGFKEQVHALTVDATLGFSL